MGKTNIFKEDTPHGMVKRVMYKKYLEAYIATTQNEQFNLKTIIIDGFAGPGRYMNYEGWPEEIEKYGSPLIALKVTLDFLLKKAERLADKTSSDTETSDEANKEDTEESSKASETEPIEKSSIKATVTEPQTDKQENKPQHQDKVSTWISAVNHPDDKLEEIAKSKRQEGFDENTDITLIFIDVNKEHYISLVNNIELMLVKFLMSCLPTYSYKYRENREKDKHSTTFSMDIPPYSFAIKVHNMTFEKFDPPKELAAKCTRSLTFLDPFGFKYTPMEHVKKFAPEGGNGILINFMSKAVHLNIKEKDYIRALYGIEDQKLDEFVNYISDSKNKEDLNPDIRKCTERYERYLTSKTQTAYAQSFEVRNKNDLIIYHLIHITNHIRGVEAMKESMNRCSQKSGEMAMSEYDIFQKGHKLNFENLDDPDVVADRIFENFKGQTNVLLEPTIKEFVLLDTKFLYRKNAIKTLQKQGKITVVDEKNEPQKRKNTFPDKDCETKRPKKWYVSFALEAPVSDYSFKLRHKLKEKKREEKKKQKDVKQLQREKEKMEKEKDREQREAEEEISATAVAETKPMAPAETDASRVAETEPMAAAKTSSTRLDETEPMAMPGMHT